MKKKTKKSQLNSEYIIIVASIAITGIVLFLINNMITTINTDVKEITPELNYEFPLTFIHSFLFVNLKEKDKKKFKKFKNINFVKDLIWINNVESKKLLKIYREDYIKLLIDGSNMQNSNLLELYNQYSNDNNLKENLIKFTFDVNINSLDDFSSLISKKNAAIPIKTRDFTITVINFK